MKQSFKKSDLIYKYGLVNYLHIAEDTIIPIGFHDKPDQTQEPQIWLEQTKPISLKLEAYPLPTPTHITTVEELLTAIEDNLEKITKYLNNGKPHTAYNTTPTETPTKHARHLLKIWHTKAQIIAENT